LYDDEGNEIQSDTLKQEQLLAIYGDLGLQMVFSPSDYVVFTLGSNQPRYTTERVLVQSQPIGDYTNSTTQLYGLWNRTIAGQQSIAESRDSLTTANEVTAYVGNTLSNSLNLLNVTVQTAQVGRAKAQARPSEGDRTNAAYAKDGDPNNGWRTESEAELELALGSATAQRRIEFSMPYAPDDIFSGPSGGPFTATASDAPAKANRYGRVQNRLLLGNRSGVNLQLAPERLPAAPFTPLYLQADGLTALYRANGNQWAFDSNGIVCSTDALFWAAVGGTGTFWFPVAPGITTLPAEPAIVDGTMNATNVVLPYNETAIYESRLRLGNVVTKFNYALELLTTVPALKIDIGYTAERYQLVRPPAAAVTVAAFTPVVASSATVRIPSASDTTIAAAAPTVGSAIGSFVAVPASTITLAAVALTTTTNGSVPDALLLHMDGSNGSTTFTDSSSNALTVTANGNAQISTAQSKFGGASAAFDGDGDFLSIASNVAFAFGAAAFTIECWAYQSATPNGTGLISEEYTGPSDAVTFAIGFCDGTVGAQTGSRPFFGIYT
jgi:hypothetical protein